MPQTESVPPFSKKREGVRRYHAKDKIEKVSRTVGTGERNRLAPTGKRRHHTKMKRYDAHCKTILLGKALGRRSLQETARPAIKSKVSTAHNKERLVIAQNTHDQPAQGFSFSCEKQPQTAHGSGTGWGAAR